MCWNWGRYNLHTNIRYLQWSHFSVLQIHRVYQSKNFINSVQYINKKTIRRRTISFQEKLQKKKNSEILAFSNFTFTEFILFGTERTGNTERFMPTGQWAIGNVSITFLKTPIYIPLFSSLHRHNPPQALIINFTFGDNKWPMTFLTPFTPSKGPLAVVLAYTKNILRLSIKN